MTNLLISFLIALLSPQTNVEPFEGTIKMVQETCYETFYYTYYVKGDNLRIDKFDNKQVQTKTLVLNLKEKQVQIISPSKKVYSKVKTKTSPSASNEDFSVLKTENFKLINNLKCYQWRVKNTENNTEVSYWVTQNNFYFFREMIKLLNGIDNSFEYFDMIPESEGFFPMLAVERTLLRKEKGRFTVQEINYKNLDESLFVIPSDYTLVDTNL